MRNSRQTGVLVGAFALVWLAVVPAMAAVDFQPPLAGSTFQMTETYAATFDYQSPEVSVSGDLAINATTNYTVIGLTTYTQICPEIPGHNVPYNVYEIRYTGTANVTGMADIVYAPFSINWQDLPIRINNATWDGYIWLRDTDLATVAKKREIVGSAEAELPFLGWMNAANAVANEFEEYILPLEDYRWPLTVGDSWNQSVTICPHGDYSAEITIPLIPVDPLSGDFSTTLDLDFDITVPQTEDITISLRPYTTYKVDEHNPTYNASQIYNYSPDLRWILRQEITRLEVAGIATIQQALLQVNRANVPPTPTSVVTNTPTPVPTNTPGGDTPTPMPTDTPGGDTPTATPTPVLPTETPIPGGQGPHINLAGYMTSYITASGGNLNVLAWVTDPDGDAIDRVELWFGGAPTGLNLNKTSEGIYEWFLPNLVTGAPMSLLLELKAFDETGAGSNIWPHLMVKSGSAPAPANYWEPLDVPQIAWSTENMLEIIEHARAIERYAGPGGPFVAVGGFLNTDVYAQSQSTLTFGVVPIGANRVELYYDGSPTGVPLRPNATPLGPGVYGISFGLDAGSLPGGMALPLQAKAFDDGTGGESDLWPYLVIH
jgi:hypothetical protein